MKRPKIKPTTTVLLTVRDSWSGSSSIGERHFRTRPAALRFCEKFNSKNTATQVPEYYEIAEIKGEGWGFAR